MAETLRSALSGWKTYIVAVLGVVYALGIKFAHWPNEPEIWAGLGFTGVATLRAAIAKLCAALTAATPPAPVNLEFDDAAAGRATAAEAARRMTSLILAAAILLPRLVLVLVLVLVLGFSAGCQNMTPEQKAQWSATASVVAQKAVAIALNTVVAAAQSESDAGAKADWLDSLSSGLRAQAPSLVTSDDFKAIAAIWTPTDKPHWRNLADELADLYERTKDLPEAERVEAIAKGLNEAAGRARIPASE